MHVSSSPDLALSVDTDQATSDVRVTGNLAHHTEGGTMYQHYGHNVTIDNNIFALATVRAPSASTQRVSKERCQLTLTRSGVLS